MAAWSRAPLKSVEFTSREHRREGGGSASGGGSYFSCRAGAYKEVLGRRVSFFGERGVRCYKVKAMRVLLVDDHPVVRFGLRTVLEVDCGFEVVGEATDPRGALEAARTTEPDVIVLDLVMGGRDDLGLLRELRVEAPDARVVVFSAQPERVFAWRAFQAGASGYLMKDEGVERVPEVLRVVMKGKRYASEEVQRAIFQAAAGGSPPPSQGAELLSDREVQVLRMLGSRKGTAEIAKELGLSMKTISTYRERLKNKLGAESGRELEQKADEFVRTGRV